ncbi:epoxide hydrolase family protein [Leptospira stimsonii]|uniref:Epoxide hydrolase n=1 Tax=Leptospira stimsonii TaxID=2202203 RepID=A0ABY2N1X2_9LEPT|nr:epoxide hydrolase family protein [Leptospira stimsonii]TGK20480.1 epoxide hydrolase [Leptospira stimsonii]TGM14270.1 epoxide hydrolase [Leptospira stimsonii]
MLGKKSISEFKIQIPEEEIQFLKNRLKQTRFAPPIDSSNWSDGTDADYLRELIRDWGTRYDWRSREILLNRFDHFLADIEGTKIHFIHAKGKGKNPIPLLLLQGWPSSFIQMLDIIPLLTEAQEDDIPSFDVVAASLPGYLFSEIPSKHGMSFSFIADLMQKLMVETLGYKKYAARGSDQGALVQQQLGLKYPENLIGLHRTGITPFLNPLPADLSEEEIQYQQKVASWAKSETAYASLQALRPETITPALADSPIALASWVIEKFQRWGDCNGDPDRHFGRDKLLDNLSLHWFYGAGAASVRLYREVLRNPGLIGKVNVPTAIIMPLRDGIAVPFPRSWAERFYNVQRWTVLEKGGHFSEWEVPETIAEDIRSFFKSLTEKR